MRKFLSAKRDERGMALALAVLMVLILSTVVAVMMTMSTTESVVSANFRDEQTAFFASRAGIEEVRDRLRFGAPNSLNTYLPTALPGSTNGVVYVTNALNGETVAPWNTTGSNYPDDEICKELGSTICTGTPPQPTPSGTWYTNPSAAVASSSYAATPPLPWKWARLMAKINKSDTSTTRVTSVDGLTNGNRVCWGGTHELVVTTVDCPTASASDAQVYELTALSVTPSGSRRMVQYELTTVTFPMPGAMVVDGVIPNFQPATSNAFAANGADAAQGPNNGAGCGSAVNEPAIGTYTDATTTMINTIFASNHPDRSGNYTSAAPYAVTDSVTNVNSVLSYNPQMDLTTVDGLQNLVNFIKQSALPQNIYNTNNPTVANPGTNSNPVVNVINGDANAISGAGVTLITGCLNLSGNPSYNGLILLIGKGCMSNTGGGNGTVNGAIFIANMYSDVPPVYTNPIALGANPPNHAGIPYIAWSGGGTFTLQYDSCWVALATKGLPLRLLAMRELVY